MRLFGSWLSRAKKFAAETYGDKPAEMSDSEWGRYVYACALAGHHELVEALECFDWEPWKSGGRPSVPERDQAVRELVDVLFFTANILNALYATDEEISMLYEEKMRVNARRVKSGQHLRRDSMTACLD